MENLNVYSKYYNLEDYLLTEVSAKFKKEKSLSAFDFFCICIWKSPRQKSNIYKSLVESNTDIEHAVRDLTTDLFVLEPVDKFKRLMNIYGVNVAMASGILTILYPDLFTVYDFRVCEHKSFSEFKNLSNMTNRDGQFLKYQSYVNKVKNIHPNVALREIDKMLWGKSFYDELTKDLKENFIR